MAVSARRRDLNMTEGSITGLLIAYSVPLLIGNIFQQLYNTADSVIVGNYVGKEALAAVGCTGTVINTMIGIFTGLASGAGVVISQYYGSGDREKLHHSVQTAIIMTLVLSVFVTVGGVLLVPAFLHMMRVPADVYDSAKEYLRIFFMGAAGLLIYNMGAGILRAVGDSRRPLYFLIFSVISNTVLDIILVRIKGIAGAAIATVIAEIMSAVLVIILLIRTDAPYRITPRSMHFSPSLFRRICAIGLPTAIQLGLTSFSNVFVQSYINSFESACMAGWTAYNKIDSLLGMPIESLSLAVMTFVGQNLGAGKYSRARSSEKAGLVLSLSITALIITPIMIFAPFLVGLFNRDPDVIENGVLFLRLISPFFLFYAISRVHFGILQGSGDTRRTSIVLLLSYVAFRQAYLFIATHLGGGIIAVGLGYPLGWVLCMVLLFILYRTSNPITSLERRSRELGYEAEP